MSLANKTSYHGDFVIPLLCTKLKRFRRGFFNFESYVYSGAGLLALIYLDVDGFGNPQCLQFSAERAKLINNLRELLGLVDGLEKRF